MRDKIIEILKEHFYKEKGDMPIILVAASDLLPLIEKRDELIKEQGKLLEDYRGLLEILGRPYIASDIRQKIESLTKEIETL
jgi:hypothetical protein